MVWHVRNRCRMHRVTVQEFGNASRHRFGLLHLKKVTHTHHGEFLELREPAFEQVRYFHPQPISLGAEYGEHWLNDCAGLRWSEPPRAKSWQLYTKSRVCVLDRLRQSARDVTFHHSTACVRLEAAYNTEKTVHGRLVVAGALSFQ